MCLCHLNLSPYQLKCYSFFTVLCATQNTLGSIKGAQHITPQMQPRTITLMYIRSHWQAIITSYAEWNIQYKGFLQDLMYKFRFISSPAGTVGLKRSPIDESKPDTLWWANTVLSFEHYQRCICAEWLKREQLPLHHSRPRWAQFLAHCSLTQIALPCVRTIELLLPTGILKR